MAGVLLSLAIPTLHGEEANLLGGFWGLVGAALGYGLLWAVVELGKLAFGRRKLTSPSRPRCAGCGAARRPI